MTKSFSVAARRANDQEAETMPFNVDGTDQELYIRTPKEGQIALVMSVMGGYAEGSDQVATVINVFMNMLTEESAGIIRRRLLDMDDEFDLENVMDILSWAVEEAAARPTKSSPASTSSRPTSGTGSTGPAPVRTLTRSRSPRSASAT
jgi:hypothetical protein